MSLTIGWIHTASSLRVSLVSQMGKYQKQHDALDEKSAPFWEVYEAGGMRDKQYFKENLAEIEKELRYTGHEISKLHASIRELDQIS